MYKSGDRLRDENFAYRTSIGLWMFIFSAMLPLGIALMTASIQAVKAAIANPLKSLQYE